MIGPDSFLHMLTAIGRNTAHKFDKVKAVNGAERTFFGFPFFFLLLGQSGTIPLQNCNPDCRNTHVHMHS